MGKTIAVIEVNINHIFGLTPKQSKALIAFAKASVKKKAKKPRKKK